MLQEQKWADQVLVLTNTSMAVSFKEIVVYTVTIVWSNSVVTVIITSSIFCVTFIDI